MGQGQAAEFHLGEQRLHVAQQGLAGGGIAHMADRAVALELADHRLVAEAILHMAQITMIVEGLAVERDDAGRLLAAVLERMQAQRHQGGRLGMTVNAEDAAFLAQMIVVEGIGGEHGCRRSHHWLVWNSRSIWLRLSLS